MGPRHKAQSGILRDRGQLEAFRPRETTGPHQILVEPLDAGAVVTLPRVWPVRRKFRRTFSRLVPLAPWCWLILGKRALRRAETFAAECAAELEREARRRACEASEREWEGT